MGFTTISRHAGEKLFPCSICAARFASNSGLHLFASNSPSQCIDRMATSTSRDPNSSRNLNDNPRGTSTSDDEDDVISLDDNESPEPPSTPEAAQDDGVGDADLRGTPEQLMETLKNRFKFLYPRFFALTKMTKDTRGKKKKRTDIGLHFTCRNCPNTILSAGVSSTSNLRRHIKSHHPSLLKEYNAAWEKFNKEQKARKRGADTKQDQDVSDAKKPKKVFRQPELFASPTQEQVDRKVIKFIIETNQPYFVVEADSFKEVALMGATDKKVMCRNTLAKKIVEKFEQMNDNVKVEFNGATCICITSDIWSCATRSFIGKE